MIRPNAREIFVGGDSYVNLSSNDYLSLSFHPELVARSREWAKDWGAGSGASRLITGNLDCFEKIETKIATLKGTERALILGSGYQANATLLQALFDRNVLSAEPQIFTDRLNHNSMHFGCQAAQVRQKRYRHLDYDHLEELLAVSEPDQPRFILTESVFSMDGDICDMERISTIGGGYEAFVICDDAHATGILGVGGKGLSQGAHCVMGTFSKALGSFGAYVACSETVYDFLVNRCGGLIYSTALPPSVLGSIDAALDMLPELDQERRKVADLAATFRNELKALGFDVGNSRSQIVPVMVGEPDQALDLSQYLRLNGFWVTAIRPPTVPQGSSRLRFAFTAALEKSDVESCLNLIENWSKKNRNPVES
ncbi:MAG: aminotransferase class I/II-fold pyridoxal phosphate-dependent enzyme [Methyloligellaceae bacterium]